MACLVARPSDSVHVSYSITVGFIDFIKYFIADKEAAARCCIDVYHTTPQIAFAPWLSQPWDNFGFPSALIFCRVSHSIQNSGKVLITGSFSGNVRGGILEPRPLS